jgi:hypothetical protein
MLVDISDWVTDLAQSKGIWYIKRLSGNDTLANGTHQAGPYIPKGFLFDVLPKLNRPKVLNPDATFEMCIDSHTDCRDVRAIWYNNKLHGGTRNEARITQLGGTNSALLDPESTGALAIFAFLMKDNGEADSCHVWVCRNETEADVIEDKVGPVEPGKWIIWRPQPEGSQGIPEVHGGGVVGGSCWLCTEQIPADWLLKFPTGQEIIDRVVTMRPEMGIDVDKRILHRRECEFELYRSVEEAVELPYIKEGFANLEDFLARAQTILQRRKARAGLSLELHTRAIFIEEGLKEGKDFSYDCESELGKKPDFLFPSEVAYKNESYSEEKLRMLAVKTTCRDRWRQILNEANRIGTKHLFTLQEGVSEKQFQEMVQANVKLVVPEPLINRYPKKVQPELQTLESFMADIRILSI